MKYSQDELGILKRKSVTREVLFEYLHEKDCVVPVETTKSALISKICNFWNLQTTTCKFEETQQPPAKDNNENAENLNVLGERFAEWFYNMLNTTPVIGSEHFWQDCTLTLNLISEMQTITETVSDDCEKIANVISTTKTTHNLFFNPNLSREGTKTKMDPHGLVIVMVCGTLHTDSKCVGVFEQIFGLARDPFSENNWKIKNTHLNLRSKSDVNELPKLCNTIENECLSITEC